MPIADFAYTNFKKKLNSFPAFILAPTEVAKEKRQSGAAGHIALSVFVAAIFISFGVVVCEEDSSLAGFRSSNFDF